MPTPPAIVVGNWKSMHQNSADAIDLAKALAERAASARDVKLVVCPPSVLLEAVQRAVAGSNVAVGAQNMHHDDGGEVTGEIAPPLLAGLCEYVIIGHSDRRSKFGEENEFAGYKVANALRHKLRPILCVGETQAERDRSETAQAIAQQLGTALPQAVQEQDATRLVVAYEPLWASDAGSAPNASDITNAVGIIKHQITEILGNEITTEIPVLYGGSVTTDNAAQFAKMEGINGVLVGRASLDPTAFLSIADAFSSGEQKFQDFVGAFLEKAVKPATVSIDQAFGNIRRDYFPNDAAYQSVLEGLRTIKDELDKLKEWEKGEFFGRPGESIDDRSRDSYELLGNIIDDSSHPRSTVTEVIARGYRSADGQVFMKAKVRSTR